MAVTNRERVGRGLEELTTGLVPFTEREYRSRLGRGWVEDLLASSKRLRRSKSGIAWDAQSVLKGMVDNWHRVFRDVLGPVERAYVSELIEIRNRWAHENPFTSDDVYRALDTMQRMLQAVSAGEQSEAIGKLKADLQRTVFADHARKKTRAQLTLEGMPQAGLSSWREVITPHRDVASGKYMQAEFAADLNPVHKGEGSDEYRDPHEFFRRTYITSGLRDLLVGALQRVAGTGGDPVVELQTNFGGGKTHSMLALYHLFSGVKTSSLEGIEPVLKDAGVEIAPKASRAVLVGTAMSPGDVTIKEDGTEVRTLWGEMAWQLGGAEGYGIVAESDRMGTSPGSDDLAELFRAHSPCLILIDEWVAYARQLLGKRDLPAGDFGAQDSFAQALTEAAKRAEGTLVVASIPASKIEIGGEAGERAVEVLKNVFERVGKPWRPATGDEGFEIVRRRLFEPISGKDQFASRDAVVTAFAKMYREAGGDFPSECSEGNYKDELLSSYPIHPELFRRLYDDWSTLDRFQRTRGVLRLLAKVIHRLWEGQDQSLLILPSSVPMDDGAVKSELTRYLADEWEPIISQEVDGPNSLPLQLDRDNPNLGRVSACRRVARALYVGTAPGAHTQNPGVGAERIRLACVQPGESAAVFGDALRRIMDRGRYVQQDVNRYWISTKANLNRTAHDRASDYLKQVEELDAEIVRRLELDRMRGDFAGMHICPHESSEVPDEPTTRLVIMRPEHAHKRGKDASDARSTCEHYLNSRGNSPRLNRNALVFLAADEKLLADLREAASQFLGWSSILRDRDTLDLTRSQERQAETRLKDADRTVDLRISATWIWALAPYQEKPASTVDWDEVRVTGDAPLAKRTGSKLVLQEKLMPAMGGVILRMKVLDLLWNDRDHVSVAELNEWLPRYLYLPRVKGPETIAQAVRNGADTLLVDETFATAEAFDQEKGRYLGLKLGGGAPPAIGGDTCLVKPDVARRQRSADEKAAAEKGDGEVPPPPKDSGARKPDDGTKPDQPDGVRETPSKPKAFVGSVKLSGARVGRDAGRIADEVLSHLAALPGAKLKVTLEIHADVPGGVDPDIVRTVSENATTLRFDHASFEDE